MEDPRKQTQSRVILVATVHQPNDALGELTRATLPRCEGLEFETADRYQAEIARAGGLERWLEAQSSRPELWVHRLRVACEIAEAALRVEERGQRQDSRARY